ncbi:hypothetical protein V8G54_031086 [Vigna mungo]|uniref:F-box domain-containing protein n=1 Tax=Vigna mungo TaxID=3915 RepID=A0AAQ3RP60_VIGMU
MKAILQWELVIEILLMLPVKSLVHFKCVYKSWLCLLSDPHFGISHFQRLSASFTRLLFIAPPSPEIRSIDFNASLHDDYASATLNLNFLPPNTHHNVQIIVETRYAFPQHQDFNPLLKAKMVFLSNKTSLNLSNDVRCTIFNRKILVHLYQTQRTDRIANPVPFHSKPFL